MTGGGEAPENGRFNPARIAIRAPALVVIFALIFVGWGLRNYLTMPRREDPEIKITVALVIAIFPGASAEKVEEQVTRKLEDAIEPMDHLRTLSSTTRANIAVISVEMDYSVDADMEWQKLRARLAAIRDDLPETLVGPKVWDGFGDTTALIAALTGADPVALGRIAEDLKSELDRVPGAGEVTVIGKPQEVVYVEGRRADMARAGLTPYGVRQMLDLRNLRLPGGRVATGRYAFQVEPTGAYRSAADVESTILDVSTETGRPLHVRDVFTVRRAAASPPETEMLVDGSTAVAVGVVMKPDYNIVALGRDLSAAIAAFRPRLPSGVKLELLHESPRQVAAQVSDFTSNLIEGIAIVVVVMAVFLGLRSALISATAIPLSVLLALAVMPILRIDLEMVSIASFIVALGMLVDDSIIIADNIDTKLRQGLAPVAAAVRGTEELTTPAIIGTLGTVAAFLPMLLLHDEVGAYTRSLPLVVSASLLGSLAVSLTVTPLLARWMLGRRRDERPAVETTRVARAYRRLMGWCLGARALVVLGTLAGLAVAGWMLYAIGFSFFPDAQRDQLVVDVWLKEGSSIAETRRVAVRAEADLRRDRGVRSTAVFVGEGSPRFYITVAPEFQKTNYAAIMVNTADADETQGVVERFNRRAGAAYPGARVFARKLVMGMPIAAPVEIRVSGPDIRELRRIGAEVREILRRVPGAAHIQDDFGPDVASLEIEVDEERANRVGVTNTDVSLAFLSTFEGLELTRFVDGDDEIPVVLRLDDEERGLRDDLKDLPVASTLTGAKVPLGSIAEVKPVFGPGVIERRAGERTLTVQAWTDGRLANDVINDAWPMIAGLRMPPGYRVQPAGEKEELDKALNDLVVVFAVIVISLVVLLMIQVGTLRRMLVVLLTVPLSAIGAAFALYFCGYSFSFMAFLGVISLAGIAIRNTVVWIEFVERHRRGGGTIREAIILAGIFRLRPILMTAVTTVGGLLPLAIKGGVLFEPMASAMIAGLSLATVFTLVVIPVCYTLIMPAERETPGRPAAQAPAP